MSHQPRGYRVTWLVFDAGQPYEKFRGRHEAAVPPADLRPGDCPGWHVRWQDAAADTNGSGPRGIVLYWRADMTPELTGSGELRPCTAYLMGHHAIPEKACRHDPAVMLYAPRQIDPIGAAYVLITAESMTVQNGGSERAMSGADPAQREIGPAPAESDRHPQGPAAARSAGPVRTVAAAGWPRSARTWSWRARAVSRSRYAFRVCCLEYAAGNG